MESFRVKLYCIRMKKKEKKKSRYVSLKSLIRFSSFCFAGNSILGNKEIIKVMNFKSGKLAFFLQIDGARHFSGFFYTNAADHVLSPYNKTLKVHFTFLTADLISCLLGSNFLCATHIIPVKNEEGVVMMFILNFDYILDEGSSDSLEKLNHSSPSKAHQCK